MNQNKIRLIPLELACAMHCADVALEDIAVTVGLGQLVDAAPMVISEETLVGERKGPMRLVAE